MGKRGFDSESSALNYLQKNGFELVKDTKIIRALRTIGIHTMGVVDFLVKEYKYTVVY